MIDIKFTKGNDFEVGKWSGGTTTQLAIYPKDAIYKEQNFMWRISSAKVEIIKSAFTKLSEYNRVLMVLDGKLELVHKNQHSATLNQFESDYFSGSWETSSFGKVTDYNLMMDKNCVGDIDYIEGSKASKIVDIEKRIDELESKHKRKFAIHTETFYCYSGKALIECFDKSYVMSKGDFLHIDFDMGYEDMKSKNISIKGINECSEVTTSSSCSAIINTFVSY